MPNWCENYLTIRVPTKNRDQLLEDIKGPQDWIVPEKYDTFSRKPEMTAHEAMQYEKFIANTPNMIQKLRKLEKQVTGQSRPEWMSYTRDEMFKFYLHAHKGTKEKKEGEVAFSVAKLSPLTKREFELFFPGSIDKDGFWDTCPEDQNQYNSGRLGYIALRNQKLGIKWPPSNVEMILFTQDTEFMQNGVSYTDIAIAYTTPWGPISDPASILDEVLIKNNAEAVIVWKEEDQHSGYFHLYPSQNIYSEEAFNHGSFQEPVEDEDYPDDHFSQWNDEELINEVSSRMQDSSLVPIVQ